MIRRIIQQVSAGGVVARHVDGQDDVCLILRDRHGKSVWGLPKGHLEAGEDALAAALREVQEETGLRVVILTSIREIRYRFTLKDDGSLYAKTVQFFLMQCVGGDLTHHDTEVREARWMPIEDALAHVAYENERQVLTDAKRLLTRAHIRSALREPE